MPGPLTGIRVLDFGRVVAAPRSARLMADLGADVIHIERPVLGDDTREDPYVFFKGMSGAFIQQNWGKKSLCINLKHADAHVILYPLIEKADVVIENFRPGLMDALGLGYGKLSSINPGIVMCSISAFGQDGPYAGRIGYGYVVDAIAGMAMMTGDDDAVPTPPHLPMADGAAGLLAFGLICAALQGRHATGKGRYIDLSLLEAVTALHERPTQLFLSSQGTIRPTRRGLHDDLMVPWGYFEARDGWICIICATDRQWAALCAAMGSPAEGTDPRYATNDRRIEHRAEIYERITRWIGTFVSRDEIDALLSRHNVPCGKINIIPQVLEDPQVTARRSFVTRQHPQIGPVRLHNFLGSSMADAELGRPAPLLGQHTREVALEAAGLDEATYRKLLESGCLFESDVAASGV
ncbi:CoA transferase [Mesorhizobium sp.]|uniref:CaiB/BaiF CoA transferase family protein n=1 Tax=Mesorhizobium sp. TaxID=1871066 RepID=UPI000FE605E7|nr:CoA transferase [Mesorhizobium sp.]RWI88903.1 MAG: CoA transferase [Mesorhizobium sp.]